MNHPLPFPSPPIRSSLRSITIAALATLAIASSASAQIWNETGDAGEFPGTAQTTVGPGAITEINGNLAAAADVDMYCIRVTNPSGFFASLQCVVNQGPDLRIFNSAGIGVSANYLCQSGAKFVSGAFATTVGTYYLTVTFHGREPFVGTDAIWQSINGTEQAPNGPGAGGVVNTWLGNGNVQPINPYRIILTGASFCDDATPTSSESWGALKLIYR
ncbi:MAG: hypothetical protein ABIS67_10625 [Candidatus Eisenbacteria bacterium]